MPIINRIADFHADMTAWRHDIHAHPETAFEETRTAGQVAELLESFGIAVERGVAKTGVIGTLKGSAPGHRAIALRADMDALHVHEKNGFAHASTHDGRMHACGHDGHTTMLLGAARYLAETRNFAGTIHFIFQPAEENEGGARVMVEEGVLARHPVEAIYGMHNWPGLAAGQFAIRPGPMMAAFDIFEITVTGRGAHAAMPHLGIDPVVVSAQIVNGLQTITSRNTHPLQSAVVSVTQIHGGDTWNVIPDDVVLRGTTRSFDPAVRDAIEPAIRRIAEGAAASLGASVELRYERRYPPTVNSTAETEIAATAAADLVGAGNVKFDLLPSMGAEDFAWFLQEKPGAYIWIGNGETAANLHNPHYDFNDEILPLGASYWVRLAENVLGR
ncbi:MAG TPA: M20 aminoacylase family protein [Stellaceae bacterium]|jgi:hippurate hydrolase|nr:M20 aminoacylase family protein [Stellaceae bacterium]